MKAGDIVKSLIIPFLLGGGIIAGVKLAAMTIKDPALASIIAGLPTGLLAAYFISQDSAEGYASNYVFVASSLVMSIIVFWLLLAKTPLGEHKNIALTLSLVFWALLVFGRYLVLKLIHKKDQPKSVQIKTAITA